VPNTSTDTQVMSSYLKQRSANISLPEPNPEPKIFAY